MTTCNMASIIISISRPHSDRPLSDLGRLHRAISEHKIDKPAPLYFELRGISFWPEASVICVAAIRPEPAVKPTCRDRSTDAVFRTRHYAVSWDGSRNGAPGPGLFRQATG